MADAFVAFSILLLLEKQKCRVASYSSVVV